MDVVETIRPIVKVMTDEQLQQVYDLAYELLDKRGKLPQVKSTSGSTSRKFSSRVGRSWAKTVTAVDYKAKANGYAIDGEFVSIGEKWRKQVVNNGDYMVVKSAKGTVAWGQRMAGTACSFDDVEMTDFLMHGKGTMADAVEWFKSQGLPQK